MDREQAWEVIGDQRRALADLLAGLAADEWEQASLCDGWRVRDVAAHVVLGAHPPGVASLVAQGVRARGNFHRLNHDIAVRYARRPDADLAGELRRYFEEVRGRSTRVSIEWLDRRPFAIKLRDATAKMFSPYL